MFRDETRNGSYTKNVGQHLKKPMKPILTLIIMFSLFGFNKGISQEKKIAELPLFGEININPTKDYETTTDLNNNKVRLDLNFDSDEINDIGILNGVKLILENLAEFDKKAKTEIASDFSKNGTVAEYIEHHLSELNETQISELFKSLEKKLTDKQNLLAKIKLERVGFFPENKNGIAIFDYTIGKEFTNYLIVVEINEKGEIVDIRTES